MALSDVLLAERNTDAKKRMRRRAGAKKARITITRAGKDVSSSPLSVFATRQPNQLWEPSRALYC